MRRSTWWMLLVVAALALTTWFALRASHETGDAARSNLIAAGGSEAARTAEPASSIQSSDARRQLPGESAPASPAPVRSPESDQRGSLAVDFVGREPLDRLHLIALDGDRNVLESREVDADRVVLTGLATGDVRLHLSHALGQVLSNGQALVRANELTTVTLGWPAPLPDRRHRTIRGDLLVSLEILQDLPARGLQLELAPLLDSEAQKREALESRQLRVDQLAYGKGDARRFSFEGLPEGGYELRLLPLFAYLPVRLAANDVEVEVRFECGPVGRALLNFEGPDRELLHPRSVRARPVGGESLASDMRVPWNAKYGAFDFAAQSGDYALELELEGRRRATLHWKLEPGRSEHRLEAPSHGPIEIQLLGATQGVRVSNFSVTPEGDGRVLSLRLLRGSKPEDAARLVLSVDRVGTYRIEFERTGQARQFLVVTASPNSSDAVAWRLE